MKRNGKHPERPPTLLIQQIRLEWHKSCRGGDAAARRNQYPRAMRLPEGFFAHGSLGLPVHLVSVVQRPDGFHIEQNCRRFLERGTERSMKFQPFEVLRQESGIQARYRYDWHLRAAPGRYAYDRGGQRRPLNELALDLSPGDYGRAVCNGRFQDWDTGAWYYVLDILNILLLPEPAVSLGCFLDREPDQVYEQIALLR